MSELVDIKTEDDHAVVVVKEEGEIKKEIDDSEVIGFQLPVIQYTDEIESSTAVNCKTESDPFSTSEDDEHPSNLSGKVSSKKRKEKKAKQRELDPKVEREPNEKKHACPKCSAKFGKHSELLAHDRVHTGEKPYACQEEGCMKSFRMKARLNAHLKLIHTESHQYFCKVCEKPFITALQLDEHTNIHTGNKPHKCRHCSCAFSLRASMMVHINKNHTNSLKCNFEQCNKKFSRRQTLADHINVFHKGSIDKFSCTDCGALFGLKNSLQRHRKVHQEKYRLICEFCERPFGTKENLIPHLKTMHKDKSNPYDCCFCSEAFPSKAKLLIHEESVHKDIICVCNNCLLKFESINEYRQHVRAHPKMLFSYKCKICGTECAGKDKIVEHINEHNGITPFQCGFCSKQFSHKHFLQNHVRSHPEGRQKKCEICGKGCRHNADLVVHMRLHTGERPFKCEKCPQTFRAEKSLRHHAHVHTEEKAVTCDECGKTFKLKSSLVRHKWTHRDVQLHPCQYCSKSFSKRHKWVIHTRIHTGEKPFICDACGMKFKCKEGLKNHEWTHSGGKKPYNCVVCKKGFMRKAFLNKHNCAGPNSTNIISDDEEVLAVTSFKNESNPDSCVIAAIDEKIDELTKESMTSPAPAMTTLSTIARHNQKVVVDKYKATFTSITEMEDVPPLEDTVENYHSDTEDYFNDNYTEPKSSVKVTQATILPVLGEEEKKSTIPSVEHIAEDFMCLHETCRITFPNFQTLSAHNQTVHDTFMYVCKICSRNFQNSKLFDKHFWYEHLVDIKKNKSFELKCALCAALFECPKAMMKHVQIHGKVKEELTYFECHDCGQRYSLKVELKKHMNRDHRTSKYKLDYKCKECGKQCRYRAEFVVHLRKHTGEKPFACEICNQSFHAARYLKKHASVHSEEKAFTCDICGKAFKLNSSLIRHKWMHQDKKPHQCAYCEKSFGKRDLWVKHTRIHTGEKPFECEKCGLKFREKDGLKNHQWTHENGKKPYNCTTCKKGFMRKAFLNRHICAGPDWDLEIKPAEAPQAGAPSILGI